MIKEKIQSLIDERAALEGDIDFASNPAISSMIGLLTADVAETADFFEKDCTGEQLSWLSEVFDEIIIKTRSQKIINALRRCAAKYPAETGKYNINFFIDSAEDYIRD